MNLSWRRFQKNQLNNNVVDPLFEVIDLESTKHKGGHYRAFKKILNKYQYVVVEKLKPGV